VLSRPRPPVHRPWTSPIQRRFRPHLGPGKTGSGCVRFSYAASAMLWLALVVFPRFIEGSGTSARSADFTKHVESGSAPATQ
jgi:hypothetical protein